MSASPLRRLPAPALLASLALAAVGCRVPNFEGPQIQSPPPAFTMKNDVSQERRMFPARDVAYHAAWIEASWGNFSGIYINGHGGPTGIEEVETARLAAIEAARDERVEFGELEEIEVDGRRAWGWGEVWRLPNDGIRYVVFRAAVPYDTVTYAVDFLTGDPMLKSRPDSLRTIVESFAVGRIEWNYPLIAVVVGIVVLVGARLRARARARANRSRHVTLVRLPTKESPERRAAPPGPGAPGTGAPGIPRPPVAPGD
jgi:hypothetical protein